MIIAIKVIKLWSSVYPSGNKGFGNRLPYKLMVPFFSAWITPQTKEINRY